MLEADVIIIGGGVLGVSLAYHLAKNGRRTILIERESNLGQHASGKNSGMFRQLYRNDQLSEWAYRSRLTWPTAVKDAAFNETGSCIAGRTIPAHHSELFQERTLQYCHNTKNVPAILTPSDGLLDPPKYLQAIYEFTDKSLVKFILGETVKEIGQSTSGWQVSTAAGQKYSAEQVVNCAGAWINSVLMSDAPTKKMEAHAYARHLFVTSGDDAFLEERKIGFYWDEHCDWYMRSWHQHKRLLSICDKTKADPDEFKPDLGLFRQLQLKLNNVIPDWQPVFELEDAWHCFRTYTDDQLPVWGADPEFSGLFWLAAFGGFGMSTSWAASADAASYLCGKQLSYQQFSPSRVRTENLL